MQAEARRPPPPSRRKAQRAADRAHNEAVLSAAGTDEQIAQSLAQDETQVRWLIPQLDQPSPASLLLRIDCR